MSTQTKLEDALRAMAGALPPGATLPGQRELCARFGVTTYMLHKAVHELAREGVLTVSAGKGMFTRTPAPGAVRYVRLIYVDGGRTLSDQEPVLAAFLRTTARQGLECRPIHVGSSQTDRLAGAFSECSTDTACAGIVITGVLDEPETRFLQGERRPFVIFGDVRAPAVPPALPIVAEDNFQGGFLGAESLLAQGCRRLVLLNFEGDPEWIWNREARAGVLAAAERTSGATFLVTTKAEERSPDLPEKVAEWLAGDAQVRVGILCRAPQFLHRAAAIRERLAHLAVRPEIAVLDRDDGPALLPGVRRLVCPMVELVELALLRLAAVRRGADSPGRQRLPFRQATA